MKSPFEFLLNYLLKVMNNDEQFYEKISKSIIVELVKKNVIPYSQTKIQKGQFLLPFFFIKML